MGLVKVKWNPKFLFCQMIIALLLSEQLQLEIRAGSHIKDQEQRTQRTPLNRVRTTAMTLFNSLIDNMMKKRAEQDYHRTFGEVVEYFQRAV